MARPNKPMKARLIQWKTPLDHLYSAIEFGRLEEARSAINRIDVSADQEFELHRKPDDDLELSDPLARCCHRLCLMAGDGEGRAKILPWLGIAHLLIDRGASLMRPDTSMNITAMEALVVFEADDEGILDPESLQDIAQLWARMDENPPG